MLVDDDKLLEKAQGAIVTKILMHDCSVKIILSSLRVGEFCMEFLNAFILSDYIHILRLQPKYRCLAKIHVIEMNNGDIVLLVLKSGYIVIHSAQSRLKLGN